MSKCRYSIEPGLRMKRFDDEIAEIQKALTKLTEERDSLKAYVHGHKALLSFVRRLPLDIVQEIFMACLPTHRNCVMNIVDGSVGWESELEQRSEVTSTWLQRSGECPLSISLHSPEFVPLDTTDTDTPPPTPALQMLIAFASRWQHIQFDIPAGFLKTLERLTASDVPMLKTLALNQLTSLSTMGRDPSGSINDIPILSETVLRVIAQCPNLWSYSFSFYDDADMSSGPVVEHPLLQMVECSGDLFTFRLFRRLSLPALKEFTFLEGRSNANLAAYDDQLCIRFLSSSLYLESLHLGCDQLSPSSLQNIVCGLPPTVKRLHFSARSLWNGPSINNDVLADFTPVSGLVTPCPGLQVLEINQCMAISDAALLQFITARAATLKHIRIDFARTLELAIRPQLESVIPGLDISVTHLPPYRQFSPWQGLSDAPPPLPLTAVPLY
ncbi:hypothetical protein DFH07DRAFT_982961 [Mycena maculata]|uniref:F-box domain-containing protein n=1 Tax=Mycena maculata TaxID=230809 RepID=A0AAD7IE61_9AGAR|nr:hypothetical protein DFH07DRAFT_982961 [Mycena maculata]